MFAQGHAQPMHRLPPLPLDKTLDDPRVAAKLARARWIDPAETGTPAKFDAFSEGRDGP